MGYEQAIVDTDETPVRHRITVDEFLLLDEAGAFPTEHTELIDGEIFILSPIHLPHSQVLFAVTFEVAKAIERSSLPLIGGTPASTHIDQYNLPEPDLIVMAATEGKFAPPEAVRLVIEVAYSSLRHDLVTKAALYARAGMPEYWVFDIKGARIIRMADPREGAYQASDEFAFGTTVASVTLPGFAVDTGVLPSLI